MEARTIVVVDDERTFRSLATRLIGDMGHRAVTFASGEESLDYLRGDGPADLMLLDLRMAGMNGFDVLAAVKEMGLEFPIILISGFLDEDAEQRALEFGAFMCLRKPTSLDDLEAAMKSALGLSEEADE